MQPRRHADHPVVSHTVADAVELHQHLCEQIDQVVDPLGRLEVALTHLGLRGVLRIPEGARQTAAPEAAPLEASHGLRNQRRDVVRDEAGRHNLAFVAPPSLGCPQGHRPHQGAHGRDLRRRRQAVVLEGYRPRRRGPEGYRSRRCGPSLDRLAGLLLTSGAVEQPHAARCAEHRRDNSSAIRAPSVTHRALQLGICSARQWVTEVWQGLPECDHL
mmetsp:Transcript_77446/g.250595  ORF Transcript_77446/g.250595 Transcript_77446/m.250595 type:complete len:216 (-) Transcript_77446:724-1371(-)